MQVLSLADHYKCPPSVIWAMEAREVMLSWHYFNFKSEYEATSLELNKTK